MSAPAAFLLDAIARAALTEDLGGGMDIATQTVPAGKLGRFALRARDNGTIAGIACVKAVLRLIEPTIALAVAHDDGSAIRAGDTIAMLEGDTRAILTAERVALNFVGHLSGIATMTRALVEATQGTHAKICCTRKTLPGLRALQKWAVRLGGGVNHRFGLGDGALIKDNHIALAGSLPDAIRAARALAGPMTIVQVEADTPAQARAAMTAGADALLLDNMPPATIAALAAELRAETPHLRLEASGGITAANAQAYAKAGVDFLSSGALTHSAPALDVGLDAAEQPR